MARTVTFNGITLVHPGGATKVDVTQLAQATVLPTGILGLVGEADGGVPNEVSASGDVNEGVPRIYVFDDPANAKATFRSGPLADAIGLAFDAANDPRVNNGVNRVYAIKTNQSTRSSVTLQSNDNIANDVVGIYSRDYGAHTTGITFEVVVSSTDTDYNQMDVTIVDTDGSTQDITEVGGTSLIDLQYTGPDSPTELSNHTTIANAVNTNLVVNGDITAGIDTINVGNWVVINTAPAGSEWAPLQVRRVLGLVGGATTTITIDTPFINNTGVAVALGAGFTFSVLTEVIGPFPVAAITTVTDTNDTIDINAVPNADQTLENTPLVLGTLNGANGSDFYQDNTEGPNYVRIISGPGAGQIREITSASAVVGAGGKLTVTITGEGGVGFNPAPTTDSEIMFVNVTKSSATPGDTGGALASVTGASGRATTLTVSLRQGFGEKVGVGTVRALGGANVAAIPDKIWNLEDTNSDSYSVQEIVSNVYNGVNTTTDPVVSRTNNGFVARVGSGRSQALDANRLDWDDTNTNIILSVGFDLAFSNTFGVDDSNNSVTPVKRYRLLDNLEQLIDVLNSSATAVTATKKTGAAEGAGVPYLNQIPSVLVGGVKGTTSSTDLLNAFDQLIKVRHNMVVPLWSSDTATLSINSVHQATLSHCQLGQGAGKNECHGYLALDVSANTTPNSNSNAKAQLLNAQAQLNSDRVSLGYQRVQRLNVDGESTMFGAHMYAVLAAGLKAAGGGGEPSTFKYIKATDIDFPLQLDPADRTVSNELLLNGIHFVENVEGSGYRVVRGLNTYTKSDNLAFTDESVTEVLDLIAYDLRTGIENAFTGLKATPATALSIKSFTVDKMIQYRDQEWIVDSNDPDTGERINAWRSLRVTISGDIATLRVEIFPVIGINFELIEIFAQLPTISA